MQIKNANVAFNPVTVTFETSVEYEAFRRILYATNNMLSFHDKEGEVFGELYDEFDVNYLDN